MDRIQAGRVRVSNVKAELSSPAVHSPCIKCRYYEFACTHPAVAIVSANPETGAVKRTVVAADQARSEAGACGPEGALFDARSLPGQALIAVLSSNTGRLMLLLLFFAFCLTY